MVYGANTDFLFFLITGEEKFEDIGRHSDGHVTQVDPSHRTNLSDSTTKEPISIVPTAMYGDPGSENTAAKEDEIVGKEAHPPVAMETASCETLSLSNAPSAKEEEPQ